MWREYIAFGIGLIIFTTLLYRNRTNPNIHFEGGSPQVVTAISIILGLVLIVSGIFGYFFPRVLTWVEVYSETAESMSNIYGIIVFLVLQALLIFGLFYTLVYKTIIKREESDLLLGILFFTVLSAIYWVWIIWADKFDNAYKKPFEYVFKLLFE